MAKHAYQYTEEWESRDRSGGEYDSWPCGEDVMACWSAGTQLAPLCTRRRRAGASHSSRTLTRAVTSHVTGASC